MTSNRYKTQPVLVEYIWLDIEGVCRSKNRVLENHVHSFPPWNFDGSSTGQADTLDSEIFIKPVSVYKDPFNPNGFLALCETFDSNDLALPSNHRSKAIEIYKEIESSHEPWLGYEQEFFLVSTENGRPLGFPSNIKHSPRPQFSYYCGVGDSNAIGRSLVMKAYRASLVAGLKVCGMNGEVAPGQWEIQIGPLPAIQAADDVMVLRYILRRVTEGTGISVDFGAKPINRFNGSGMHTNFSTKEMRDAETGRRAIRNALESLEQRHGDHIAKYSGRNNDNEMRLSGSMETSDPKVFTSGVGARDASVRIPTQVDKDGFGYLEDRRPSSSCDPYIVAKALLESICINK